MKGTARSHNNSSILVYLLIANGITWLCWVPGLVIGARQGYIMPNFDTYASLFKSGFTNTQHILLAIFFQLGVYGPLIGSLMALMPWAIVIFMQKRWVKEQFIGNLQV